MGCKASHLEILHTVFSFKYYIILYLNPLEGDRSTTTFFFPSLNSMFYKQLLQNA